MPEELWAEVHNTVQEAVNKTIPKKKESKDSVVTWGGFTNSGRTKRSEKEGSEGRYIQLNTEFQTIARRDKVKWSHSVVSNCLQPQGLQPTRVIHPWDFPGKNTVVGCHFFQEIFPTQGLNPGLPIVGRRSTIWATREAQSLLQWTTLNNRRKQQKGKD